MDKEEIIMSINLIAFIVLASVLAIGFIFHEFLMKKLDNYDGCEGIVKQKDADDSNVIGMM